MTLISEMDVQKGTNPAPVLQQLGVFRAVSWLARHREESTTPTGFMDDVLLENQHGTSPCACPEAVGRNRKVCDLSSITAVAAAQVPAVHKQGKDDGWGCWRLIIQHAGLRSLSGWDTVGVARCRI